MQYGVQSQCVVYYTSIFYPLVPSSLLFPKTNFLPTESSLLLLYQNLNFGGKGTNPFLCLINPPPLHSTCAHSILSSTTTILHRPLEPVITATIFPCGLQARLNGSISTVLAYVWDGLYLISEIYIPRYITSS